MDAEIHTVSSTAHCSLRTAHFFNFFRMNQKYTLLMLLCAVLSTGAAWAGNPDRQGEAGAGQLLINPWARSAGLHSTNTASIAGTDAMFLNVAGLARIQKTQIQLGHTIYLQGADMSINALALGQRVGKYGAFGVSLVSFNLGDFQYTTEDSPEGAGGTFSPSLFNMGLSYSHKFANKVSVGVTAKFVSEGLANVSARAMAMDAGVQYVTGEQDNFKFGISLRNVGSKMRFTGEGLSKARPNPNSTSVPYPITYYERSAAYELPSQLNIGMAYAWKFGSVTSLAALANFTSNSFSRDQVGAGVEFTLNPNFALRAGYKTEFDTNEVEATLDNGFSAGLSASLPVKRNSDTRISLDYSYRSTKVFNGIHNVGIRIDL